MRSTYQLPIIFYLCKETNTEPLKIIPKQLPYYTLNGNQYESDVTYPLFSS